MNQLVGTRQKYAGKIRAILDPILTAEESKQLDRIAIERDGFERQLTNAAHDRRGRPGSTSAR